MPSPIAHLAAGYLIFRSSSASDPSDQPPLTACAIVSLSLLPDLDAILGILFRNLRRYHHGVSHSIFVGFVVSIAVGAATTLKRTNSWLQWLSLTLVSYELHVIMDYLSGGVRGVKLFWPYSSRRFRFPLKTFYGLKWDEGLFSRKHITTAITEVAFIAMFYLLLHLIKRLFIVRRN